MSTMSSRGATVQVTVDDFDPLFGYSNYYDWQTPDPSEHPTWYNATPDVTGVPWHEATYHYTEAAGAKATLNFTSSSIAIYGFAGSGPSSRYSITLDPRAQRPWSITYTAANVTTDGKQGRTVLFQASNLTYAPHSLEITHLGGGLGLDLAVFTVELGAPGATLTNRTIDDNTTAVAYTGNWPSETGPFFNGTSVYTQGPQNAMTFNFTGSGVYVFGDQVDDHGLYSIYLNASATPWTGQYTPYATYNGRSGCGGGWKKACEKLEGLRAFVGGLPMGQHSMTIVNEGPTGQNATFFDFDYAVYTVPSAYPNGTASSTSPCPFTTCDNVAGLTTNTVNPTSPATGTAAPSSSTSRSAADGTELALSQMSLWAVLGAWMIRKIIL